MTGLEMVDHEHAVCPLCGSINSYVVVDLDGEWAVAVTEA